MIWIYLSSIDSGVHMTGIPRVEYELAKYVRAAGHVKFCVFSRSSGFIELAEQDLNEIFEKFDFIAKHSTSQYVQILSKQNKKQTWLDKTSKKIVRSIQKKIRKIGLIFGYVAHPFRNNDVIVSVGQGIGLNDINDLMVIKRNCKVTFHNMCHDLIPISYSHFMMDNHSNTFLLYLQQAIKVTDVFLTNSKFTQLELTKFIESREQNVPPIRVVDLGSDLYQKIDATYAGKKISEIISNKYIMYVSTIEIRKNHKVLLDAYRLLINQGVEDLPILLCVGRQGWKVDDLFESYKSDPEIQSKILFLHDISDQDLIKLYQNCLFTVYPSFVEGFGLPVAESLSFGKYCLAANTSSLPEVGGEFIDYLSPGDAKVWAAKLQFLFADHQYVLNKQLYIKSNYQTPQWHNMAKQIMDSIV
jgi:glycosyltransferase involved in cell wall biosynthesis